jgi:hypothetical protein
MTRADWECIAPQLAGEATLSASTELPHAAQCLAFFCTMGRICLAPWVVCALPQVWVHSGFLTAYRAVAPRLLALAQEVTEGMGSTLTCISPMLRWCVSHS